MFNVMPKMVIVKTSTADAPCSLSAAVADVFDEVRDNVVLRDFVTVDGERTLIVPAEICFEHDGDVMDAINVLVTEAATLAEQSEGKLVAAKMLAEMGLQLAAFEVADAALSSEPTQEWMTV